MALVTLLFMLFGAADCSGKTSGGSDPHPARVVDKKEIKSGISNVFGYDTSCTGFQKCWHTEIRLHCWQLTLEYDNFFGGKPSQRIKCVKKNVYDKNHEGENYRS